jgi:hypothetical protein
LLMLNSAYSGLMTSLSTSVCVKNKLSVDP